eukprot:6457406-Amphidinium_carterae.1
MDMYVTKLTHIYARVLSAKRMQDEVDQSANEQNPPRTPRKQRRASSSRGSQHSATPEPSTPREEHIPQPPTPPQLHLQNEAVNEFIQCVHTITRHLNQMPALLERCLRSGEGKRAQQSAIRITAVNKTRDL